MISIIIPAHNEANVIERCLTPLAEGIASGELEVIVVCNGCTDHTADLVRGKNKRIQVVETDVPSKSMALNLGDKTARGFPRFYLDADVNLPLESIRQVADVLAKEETLAAAPLMEVDVEGRSWSVRAYYKIWMALPYCRNGLIGSGVYAVSESGRQRFTEFPAVTADDGYIRLLFSSSERKTVKSCRFTIVPPKTISGLIAIKTRSYFGTLELKSKYPQLFANEDAKHYSSLFRLLMIPVWWPALSMYIYVKAVTRAKAWWRFHYGDHHVWERDDTSREMTKLPRG